MRKLGVLTLALALGASPFAARVVHAKKAKAGKSAEGGGAVPPAEELAKLKAVRIGDPKGGAFSWGMSPDQVMTAARDSVEARYAVRLKEAASDPGKQQRIHEEQQREVASIKKSFARFEGQKTGWDVSIIGPEFAQNNGEAVLVAKEDNWTRYFFFFENRLYKIFIAFNKDMVAGKAFAQFGQELAGRYGQPRQVFRDDKIKGGVKRSLDHFEWGASATDKLKLVDRSEFYGVYCLVLTDPNTERQVIEKRKITNPQMDNKDELIESVASSKGAKGGEDNDDIIDRVTGRQVQKPGDEPKHGDVVVKMPKAPTPADVNAKEKQSEFVPDSETKEKPSKKGKESAGNDLAL
jgi:hypothetical protein